MRKGPVSNHRAFLLSDGEGMARWLGIVVSGREARVVDADVRKNEPIEILADDSWPLPNTDRSEGYNFLYQRVVNYAREHKIERVIVKESAVSGRGGARKSNLLSAELRGVVIAACASVCHTDVLAKAAISKTFGDRKVDEYLEDEDFWKDEISGKALRAGSREAAMILLATRGKDGAA